MGRRWFPAVRSELLSWQSDGMPAVCTRTCGWRSPEGPHECFPHPSTTLGTPALILFI